MKKEYDYTQKCGSCKYFIFYTKNGEVLRHGVCEKKVLSLQDGKFMPYHHMEAAARACKRYQEGTT